MEASSEASIAPTPRRFELLVDADEFWRSLADDLLSARSYTYLQMLSYEGDRIGLALSRLLAELDGGVDRRVVVDRYSTFCLADKFLYSPRWLFDGELRRLARSTRTMFASLRAAGVGLRFVNPMGLLGSRLHARNHKKLFLVDDRVAYVGGLNFSAHNFHWHDLMLRIADPAVTRFLREDFLGTWCGDEQLRRQAFPGIELILADGVRNRLAFESVLELIESARRRLYVQSPYLTAPFLDRLCAASQRGVEVTVVTPADNNWRMLQSAVLRAARRFALKVELYEGRMTHLKALLADDDRLVLGSSNFDFLSYRVYQEVIAIVTERRVIDVFRRRVVEADRASSTEWDGARRGVRGALHRLQLAALQWLVALVLRLDAARRGSEP